MGLMVRVGVGLIVTAVLGVAPVGAQEIFEWSGQIRSGDILEVKGITGSVRAEVASGGAASVVAEKHGRRSDLEDVEIRVIEERDGITICAVYFPRVRGDDTCDNDGWDRDRHDRWDDDIDVDVDFVVQVPRGVEFHGAMVTGDVDVVDLDSDVEASSVTGDVTVSTTGHVRASSVSGSLDLQMESLERRNSFSTVSGDITLRLPAGTDADIEFESLSGDLDSDFDLDLTGSQRGRWMGSNIEATIGDGGPLLRLKTVSGSARLRRLR